MDVIWFEKVFISGRYPSPYKHFFRSYYIQCGTLGIPESLCLTILLKRRGKKFNFSETLEGTW